MIRFPNQCELHAMREVQLGMIAYIRPGRQHDRATRARQFTHVAGGLAHSAQAQPNPGARLSAMIGVMGLAAIVTNGPWYLLVNWSALKSQKLPNALCYLGLAVGAVSFVPVLGIVVLLLSMVWSAGLGVALLKYGAHHRATSRTRV